MLAEFARRHATTSTGSAAFERPRLVFPRWVRPVANRDARAAFVPRYPKTGQMGTDDLKEEIGRLQWSLRRQATQENLEVGYAIAIDVAIEMAISVGIQRDPKLPSDVVEVLRTDEAEGLILPGEDIRVNRGQVEGGFVQGLGWLTAEELVWDQDGKLLTHSPDTYKIPAIGDTPREFNVALLPNATQRNTIFGSKAVGEPPLMLAISVREAIRDAVAAFGAGQRVVKLASPATGEAIFWAIQAVRTQP